jgi:hypothetical protein
MGGRPDQIAKARAAGYSDAEIVSHLAKTDPRVQKAKQQGHPDAEIVKFLAAQPSQPKRVTNYQAGQARGDQARANPVPLGSRVVGDLIAPGKAAIEAIGENYSRRANAATSAASGESGFWNAAREMEAAGRHGGNAIVGLAMSPITGVMNAVTGSGARGLESLGIGNEQDNQTILNTALAGLSPVRGGAPIRPIVPARSGANPAANIIARRGRVDVPAVRARVAESRAAGVEPNLTGVVGESGQRVIRAVGAKNAPAGEILTNRARASAATAKPATMDRTRRLVNDPRTTQQMADDATAARSRSASIDYDPAYNEILMPSAAAAEALASETGQTAMRLAHRSARDLPDGAPVVQELEAAIRAVETGQPIAPMSGRTLDYTRQVLGDMARGYASDPTNAKLGAGARHRMSQIDDTLNAAPGIQSARTRFREQSQAIDILRGERGVRRDFYSTDPTDYNTWFNSLPAEAQAAERASIRQDVLDKLGKQRANSFGSIDELTSSEYAGANLRTALGPQEANSYIGNLTQRMQQTRADAMVAPSGGSRTAVLEGDMNAIGNIATAAQTGGNVLSGRWGAAAKNISDWWRARGIPDDVATELTRLASDPARIDEALVALERAVGPSDARLFIQAMGRPEVLGATIEGSAVGLQTTQ